MTIGLLKAAVVIGLCLIPLALFWLIWVALPFQHRSVGADCQKRDDDHV